MKRLPVLVALFIVLAAGAGHASVGFMLRSVPDGGNPPIRVGIWYPSAAPARPEQVSLFTQDLAAAGPVLGRAHPLIVMSHGNGGEFAGHSDTAYALAAAGFVVAAPTHTGDNYRDQSRATDIRFRVQQISAVIDDMLDHWQPGAVDAARIGGFGFSAGGLTMLVAAGGNPDFSLLGPHCAAHPQFFDCRLLAQQHVSLSAPGAPVAPFPHDARLRAIVVAAPGIGFAFTPAGLRAVTIPVQLWRADDDAVLPAPFYADAVRAALPSPPDFHTVAGAGHFDFLAPCSASLAAQVPAICTSEAGFDRVRFHDAFNMAVVAFFERTLAASRR